MRAVEVLGLFAVLQAGASASGCNHNNCLRAVIASAFTTRSGAADCASYFSVTLTPTTSGSTITNTPTAIPAYASACSGSVAYSSACSCVSATHVTTIVLPSCAAGQASCDFGPCQDVLSDPNNCGSCGNVCPSGVCVNGVCSAPTCAGSTCGSLNSCGNDCFCFETSDGTGFCGPDESCAPLADCSATSDCAPGFVCATGTCCGRNVCLNPCGTPPPSKRGLPVGRRGSGLTTGGNH